jgi:protein SPT2
VEDEYDDLDDFIVGSDNEAEEEEQELPEAEEEEEVEEEEQEVEEEEPPVGVQEILSIREQLKAKYRKQYQSNSAGTGTTSCSPSVQAPATSR